MLIIKRKKDDAILIGENIRVMVIGRQGQYVKLGIQAPKHVSIHREEIYQKIQQKIDLDLENSEFTTSTLYRSYEKIQQYEHEWREYFLTCSSSK